MKFVFASILIASLAVPALPALAAPPHKSRKPVSVKKVPPKTHRQAVEEATPTEEPDPSIKLGPEELAIDCVDAMEAAPKVSQLVVVDADGRLVGALHIHDLFKAKIV